MLPAPQGEWGMPKEVLEKLTGYGGTVEQNQAEARKIMEKLGYSKDKPLKVKVATRNIATYRDAAVILIDQLKAIYIDGELENVDTPQWFPKVARKDYAVGLNLTGVSVDDPDANLVENYSCKSERNYTQYCNPEVDRLIALQSKEGDKQKRKEIVWQIEKILVDDAARPIIDHNINATCWHPYVKGWMVKDNAIYNNTRFEDLWLDK
jgi:ABC-type transport system substrate-binding protein